MKNYLKLSIISRSRLSKKSTFQVLSVLSCFHNSNMVSNNNNHHNSDKWLVLILLTLFNQYFWYNTIWKVL